LHLPYIELSHHHEISVYDTTELYGEKGNFRVMQFSNKAIQGAIDLNNPQRILFEYPRAIIHLMELNSPTFENTFIIGHGIGTIANYFTDKTIKIAEIDKKVVELSKKYFGYLKDNVEVGDGRQILENEKLHSYDFIILDAFTEKGTPAHLTSKEFFRITRKKLDSHGSIILNLIGKGKNDPLIHAIHTTLREIYAYTKVFSLPSDGVADVLNIVIIGRNKPVTAQTRHMAGFTEIFLRQGHIIMDPTNGHQI
jgi:spermidine synthase